jgi:hypothetical protein
MSLEEVITEITLEIKIYSDGVSVTSQDIPGLFICEENLERALTAVVPVKKALENYRNKGK